MARDTQLEDRAATEPLRALRRTLQRTSWPAAARAWNPSLAVVVGSVICLSGCTTAQMTQIVTNSPAFIDQLKVISAGHTGCMPDDNAISVVWSRIDGSSLWTASCKGKTYLCSSVSTPGATTFSCALQAQ